MTTNTSTSQAPPREIQPLVDRVARTNAVQHAWNSAAPLEDLITLVLIAGLPGLYDRFVAQYEATCEVDVEYGQLYRDGNVYPAHPAAYRLEHWPITHQRKHVTEKWQPLKIGRAHV